MSIKTIFDKAVQHIPEALNFHQRNAELQAAVQPFATRTKAIHDTYETWFQRELKRPGADITTSTPSEVEDALDKVARERQAAARRLYDSHASAIRAEERQIAERARAAYAALVAVFDEARDFQRERNRYQMACGVEPGSRLDDSAITQTAFAGWTNHIDRALNPATPVAHVPRSANRLDLTGLI